MAGPQTSAWRLSLVWHGTVLDTVTVGAKDHVVTLRTGDTVTVTPTDDTLEVRSAALEARLAPGQRVRLPAGHELLAERLAARAPVAVGDVSVDTTFLHSGMIAVAMTVCAVSALWLHPTTMAADGGAGVPSGARRFLSVSGGTAPTQGKPSLALTGRPLEFGERFELRQEMPQATTTQQRPPSLARTSLEAALTAVSLAMRPGQATPDPRSDALGEAVRQVASAPVLGAGVGGLSPKDQIDTGVGAGVIGAGESKLDAIRRQQARLDTRSEPLVPKKGLYKVEVQDVPDAKVDDAGAIDATPELDPMVREHLARMIRTRHNVIRACYEAWGLTADVKRSGRLVLELTLRPDGRVERLSTTISHSGLTRVGSCIERAASEWYLGDGLVDEPTRLAFPFNLQPRGEVR